MTILMQIRPSDLVSIGYGELIRRYSLKIIPHYRITYISPTGRGSRHVHNRQEVVILPQSYMIPDPNNPLQQLEFAIKHEGINLEIIATFLPHLSEKEVTEFIKITPTGKYSRIIWFLYEFITDIRLKLQDVKNVPYVDLLDSKKYYTSNATKSKRHAINNNLLGNKEFCPVVRKTTLLEEYENKNLSEKAKKIMNAVDPSVLARATNYLYAKETKSSFGIEKIKPDIKRITKFIALLEDASSIQHLDKEVVLSLQNNIVDDEYKDKDYRKTQNYVGELTRLYQHKVHYISPKPEDIALLMKNLLACETKLMNSEVHPVIIAAILSFGFVFLHPFEDGNGRIHRFIVHYILSKTSYTPDNIIFPVSAVILKNIQKYDEALEAFSKPLLIAINDYKLNDQGELTVPGDTKLHYQYIDYTRYAEYLFACIETTIQEDFSDELDFIVHYDKTKAAIQQIIDMPDLKIDRIIRCVAQNNGILGREMRKTYFHELSDETVSAIEEAIQKGMLQR